MKLYQLIFLIITIITFSCKPAISNVDYQNLELTELNPYYPILNKSIISNDTSEIIVSTKIPSTEINTDTTLTLYKTISNSTDKSIYTHNPLEWGADYTSYYDSLNRINSLVISSCSIWKIDFKYKKVNDNLIMLSNLNNDKTDTSTYTLDKKGRVIHFEGIQYGDLLRYKKTKDVLYSDNTNIPDSIATILTRLSSDTIYLHEKFFKNRLSIDSIQVVKKEISKGFTTTQVFTNIFSNNVLSLQKWYKPISADGKVIVNTHTKH